MHIEFAPGAAGFREARHLKRIVGYYRESLHASGDIALLMGTVEDTADASSGNPCPMTRTSRATPGPTFGSACSASSSDPAPARYS